MKIAVTHPGKIGDALYTLPTIRYLAEKTNSKIDFYTSDYCRPMKELFEYQSCIDRFIVSDGYIVERMDMGVQPYTVPVPLGDYDTTIHLGFRSIPNMRLDWFMALSVGIEPTFLPRVKYEYREPYGEGGSVWVFEPEKNHIFFISKMSPYIVIAPRGETSYKETFHKVAELALEKDISVIHIGAKGEADGMPGLDCTGENLLTTTAILSKSTGFVGLMSSQLVLANGFDMPKVAPHDGKSWDMRHVCYSYNNHYPINPSAEEILSIIESNQHV